jgi:hypothetical protein
MKLRDCKIGTVVVTNNTFNYDDIIKYNKLGHIKGFTLISGLLHVTVECPSDHHGGAYIQYYLPKDLVVMEN